MTLALTTVLALLLQAAIPQAEADVRATLGTDSVRVGEQFVLTLWVTGIAEGAEVVFPELPDTGSVTALGPPLVSGDQPVDSQSARYELAAWHRRRGVVAVLGGPHVSALPEEAAPHADAVVIGEGARVWPQVLRDVVRGELRREYRGDYSRPYREVPRREVLPRGSFLTPLSVIATRGCPNRCDFCYLSTGGLRMPYRVREVERVAEELRLNRRTAPDHCFDLGVFDFQRLDPDIDCLHTQIELIGDILEFVQFILIMANDLLRELALTIKECRFGGSRPGIDDYQVFRRIVVHPAKLTKCRNHFNRFAI